MDGHSTLPLSLQDYALRQGFTIEEYPQTHRFRLLHPSEKTNIILHKMEKIGVYELSEITVKMGIECGVLIFNADGSIQMTWKKTRGKTLKIG